MGIVLSQFKNPKIASRKSLRVSKSNTNDHKSQTVHETVEGSQLIYEIVKGSYEFKIKGYSLSKGTGVGEFKTSAKFSVGGYDWVIKFYPDGNVQASEEYVSVFLKKVSHEEEKVRASFEFKLLDQSKKGIYGVHHTTESPKSFKLDWGWTKYMKRSDLEASNYLKNDCLIIHCTLGVVRTHVEEGKHYAILVPPSDMFQNLKGLLESEIGSDITIQVGNESFRAHKSILAARSPVFRAQFFGLVGNPGMETVTIKEVDPFIFKAMLLFLYSDELPKTRELSDSDSLCTTITIMQHMLAAADRFGLARLKLMCEAKLCEEITANTVATTLALAEQHQCLQLKSVCLNFATKPENLGEVMKSDGYADLEKRLLMDLLKTSAMEIKKMKPNILHERNVKNNSNT